MGNRRAVARELTNLGSVETRAGNLERAQQLCDEALRLALEIENPLLVTYCVINLAGVASASGEHEHAARLLGAGEAMIEAAGMSLNPGTALEHERHVERTRRALGRAEYERAVRAGRELERDAAIEYALRTDHVSFETERLVMRKYTQDDAGFVFDMYSRWEVRRFLAPNSKPMETMDDAVQGD